MAAIIITFGLVGCCFLMAHNYYIFKVTKQKKTRIMKNLILIFIALISTTTLFFTINSKSKETVVIIESYDNYALNLENIINYFSVIGIDEKYHLQILSQIIYETGHLCSNVRFRDNNLFGIRIKGKYKKYHHWTESVVHWKLLFYDRIENDSYYDYLQKFGKYSEQDTKTYIRNLEFIKRRL